MMLSIENKQLLLSSLETTKPSRNNMKRRELTSDQALSFRDSSFRLKVSLTEK